MSDLSDLHMPPMPSRYETLREERRLAAIAIGMGHIERIILGQVAVEIPDLPKDALLVNTAADWRSDSIIMTFAHESFGQICEGCHLPLLGITVIYQTLEPQEAP